MTIHGPSEPLQCANLKRRKVVEAYEGGRRTSDAGAMLLREIAARNSMIARWAECCIDDRDPSKVGHDRERLLGQRISGWCLGQEDLKDHDRRRDDLALALGYSDLATEKRVRLLEKGPARASLKST